MKKTTFLIFLIVISHNSFSQLDSLKLFTSNEETIIGNGPISIGAYGAFDFKLSQVQNDVGIMTGGHGGVIINNSFVFGGGGYGLATNHKITDYTKIDPSFRNRDVYLHNSYGGFYMEYLNESKKVIHYTINTLIGWGRAGYSTDANDNLPSQFETNTESSSYFVVEPGVNVEINIASFFRISAGIQYRILAGLILPGYKNSDFGGVSGNIAFKFGWFDSIIKINTGNKD